MGLTSNELGNLKGSGRYTNDLEPGHCDDLDLSGFRVTNLETGNQGTEYS